MSNEMKKPAGTEPVGGLVPEIKTIEGWNEFADRTGKSSWDDYCKPGNYVGEDVYDYFLEILPPASISRGYLQVGEPHDHVRDPRTGKIRPTFATFSQNDKGQWVYCGNCFSGDRNNFDYCKPYADIRDFLKNTYRLLDGVILTGRPKVLCNDGFMISVQASASHYCTPREDLPDGNYESCELGMPNREEELILAYAEEKKKPTKSIYPRVPVEIIDEMIKKHGGFFDARMPVVG